MIHSKQLAPYKTLEKHRTSTVQAPYKHRTQLLNNNFHKKNFDEIFVFYLWSYGACSVLVRCIKKKKQPGGGACTVLVRC